MKKQVSDFIYTVFGILLLTFCYYLPTIAGGQRDPSCTMNTAYAYAMFAWVIIGAEAVISLGWILGYLCKTMSDPPITVLKEYVDNATLGCALAKAFVTLFGYAIYFFWT